jgi:hypothetical protein
MLFLPVALAKRDPLVVVSPLLRAFRILARTRGRLWALLHPNRLHRT